MEGLLRNPDVFEQIGDLLEGYGALGPISLYEYGPLAHIRTGLKALMGFKGHTGPKTQRVLGPGTRGGSPIKANGRAKREIGAIFGLLKKGRSPF